VTGPPRRPNAKEDQMGVVMVRQKVKDGSAEEAEAAARDLFATQREESAVR
jgi:hypothetical protein